MTHKKFQTFPHHISVFRYLLAFRALDAWPRGGSLARRIAVTAAACAACLVVLVALFIAAQALTLRFTSDRRIVANLATSIETGVLTPNVAPVSPYGHRGHSYDKFTDCIALSVNLGNQKDHFMWRLAATPFVGITHNGVADPCKWLVADIKAGTVHAAEPYFRYWHGAQVYLRPLLMRMTLAKVHILNAVLLIVAAAFLVVRLNRAFGPGGVLAFFIPLAFATNILTTPAVTVHALTWIWALVSLGLATGWLADDRRPFAATFTGVFALGCVANFFDVLFSPPFAPTFIAFVALALGLRRHDLKAAAVRAFALAGAWFAGFALMWIAKWLFTATVISWRTVLADVAYKAQARSFADPGLADAHLTVFTATQLAFSYASPPVIFAAWAAALGVIAVVLWRRHVTGGTAAAYVALLSPLVIPVAWVELLRDHTLQHPGFAARSFVFFAVIPVIAALALYRAAAPGRTVRQFLLGLWVPGRMGEGPDAGGGCAPPSPEPRNVVRESAAFPFTRRRRNAKFAFSCHAATASSAT